MCPRSSKGYLAWLSCTMSLLANRALLIKRSFDPMVIIDNKKGSILVQLVSADLSAIGLGTFLAVFLSNRLDSDIESENILLR